MKLKRNVVYNEKLSICHILNYGDHGILDQFSIKQMSFMAFGSLKNKTNVYEKKTILKFMIQIYYILYHENIHM